MVSWPSFDVMRFVFASPQYKVLLYSLDGRLLSTYGAYEWSLGVKAVAWSPSSQFLAIGSYDEKVWLPGRRSRCSLSLTQYEAEGKPTVPPSCQVRILNHITWKKVAQLEHPASINSTNAVGAFCSSSSLNKRGTFFICCFSVFLGCV